MVPGTGGMKQAVERVMTAPTNEQPDGGMVSNGGRRVVTGGGVA